LLSDLRPLHLTLFDVHLRKSVFGAAFFCMRKSRIAFVSPSPSGRSTQQNIPFRPEFWLFRYAPSKVFVLRLVTYPSVTNFPATRRIPAHLRRRVSLAPACGRREFSISRPPRRPHRCKPASPTEPARALAFPLPPPGTPCQNQVKDVRGEFAPIQRSLRARRVRRGQARAAPPRTRVRTFRVFIGGPLYNSQRETG